MSDLRENTQYDNSNVSSPFKSFSGITQRMEEDVQKAQVVSTVPKETASEVTPFNKYPNLLKGYNQELADRLFTPIANRYDPEKDIPVSDKVGLGVPIIDTDPNEKYQNIPDYTKFISSEGQPYLSDPSDKAKIRNLPKDLFGGGQYYVDETQENPLIKAERIFVTPEIRSYLLGNRAPSMFEIEHIVPLWAGGTDSISNLSVLDKKTHVKKTAIQAVPLTLLANNMISLNEARHMALTWADKDMKDLPTIDLDGTGYVSDKKGLFGSEDSLGAKSGVEIALTYKKKWEKDRKKIRTSDYFKESFVEEMGEFGEGWLPDPLREGAKGFIGGVTADIIKGTGPSEDATTVDKTANYLGNLAGMLIGFGKAGKALGHIGAFGKKTKTISKLQASLNPWYKYTGIGLGIGKKAPITERTIGSIVAGLGTLGKKGVTKLAKEKVYQSQITASFAKALKSLGIDYGSVATSGRFTNLGENLWRSIATLSAYNQTGYLGRIITSEDQYNLDEQMGLAASDIIFGSLLGGVGSTTKAGQTLKGYAAIGGGTAMFAMMKGADEVEAIKEGIVMAALHGLGARNPNKKYYLSFKGSVRDNLIKEGTSTMNLFNEPGIIPMFRQGEIAPKQTLYNKEHLSRVNETYQKDKAMFPDNGQLQKLEKIDSTQKVIEYSRIKSKIKLADMVDNAKKREEPISDAKIVEQMNSIETAYKVLMNSTKPTKTQDILQAMDAQSLGRKLLPNRGIRKSLANRMGPKLDRNDLGFLERDYFELDKLPSMNTVFSEAGKEAITTVRGGGKDIVTKKAIDPKTRDAQNDFAKNQNSYDGNYYVVDSVAAKDISRWVNTQLAMNGKTETGKRATEADFITDVESTKNVYVKKIQDLEGNEVQWKYIGKLPSERGLNEAENKFHVNLPFTKMLDRFVSYIKGSKTTDEIVSKFKSDRAFGGEKDKEATITKEQAEILLENKDWVEKTDSETKKNLKDFESRLSFEKELLDMVKPLNPLLRITKDNAMISKTMRENGLKVYVGKVKSSTPEGAGYDPYNPNIILSVREGSDLKRSIVDRSIEKEINDVINRTREYPKEETQIKEILEEKPTELSEEKISEDNLLKEEIRRNEFDENVSKEKIEDIKEFDIKDNEIKNEEIVPKEIFDLESKIDGNDIRSENDGVNNAAIKAFDKVLSKLDEDSSNYRRLSKIRDTFTKENIIKLAKNSYEKSENDVLKGFELFKERIATAFKKAGVEDPTVEYENSQAYKKVFLDSVKKIDNNILTFNNEGRSLMEKSNNKKHKSKFEEITGLETLYYEENKRLETKPQTEDVYQSMMNNGYIPLAYDNKPGSIMGVKFVSKKVGGKGIGEKGAIDEYLDKEVFSKLGFKKGVDSLNDFTKRLKSLNSREMQNQIEGEIYRTIVIKNDSGLNPRVKDTTKDFEKIKVHPDVPNAKEALKNLGDLYTFDGIMYTSQANHNEIGKANGYSHNPRYTKPTQTFVEKKTNKNGEIIDRNTFHQKMEMKSWTEREKNMWEKQLEIKLKDTDMITFETNVKIGMDSVGKDMGKYKVVDSPSESFSFKYQNPHEIGGSFSLGSILSKIPAEAGLSEVIKKKYLPYAEDLKNLSRELQTAVGSEEMSVVLKKYPELKKEKWLENLFGNLKKSGEHGAGIYQFGRILNTDINKLIVDNYLKGRFFKADDLHLKTDSGVKLGKYLDSGELMISKRTFIDMYGKDAYKKLENGKDFHVLAFRYPTLKDTSMAKMKILIAERNNEPLDRGQVVVNSADTMKFDHDYDGDRLQIFKIGGERGLPTEVADYFYNKAKGGEMIFPKLTKANKIIYDGKDTYKKLKEMGLKNLNDSKAISLAAKLARPMRTLISLKYEVRFGPLGGDGSGLKKNERLVEHYLNGKLRSSNIKKGIIGENIPNGKPVFGDKESLLLGQIGQEAVDSVGTVDLSKRLEGYNDASSYIMDKLFTPHGKNKGVIYAINDFISKYQVPFNLKKDLSNNAIDRSQFYRESIKELKSEGANLGPVEEVMDNLNGIKRLDYYYNDILARKEIDKLAKESVEEIFKDDPSLKVKGEPVGRSQNTWFFTDRIAKKIKDENNFKKEPSEIMKLVNDAYKEYAKEVDLTRQERKEIALWAARENDGNFAYGNYSLRSTYLINESPGVAKAYFEGQNKYKKVETPETITNTPKNYQKLSKTTTNTIKHDVIKPFQEQISSALKDRPIIFDGSKRSNNFLQEKVDTGKIKIEGMEKQQSLPTMETPMDSVKSFAIENGWTGTEIKKGLTRFERDEYMIDVWDTKNGLTVGVYRPGEKNSFQKKITVDDLTNLLASPNQIDTLFKNSNSRQEGLIPSNEWGSIKKNLSM